MASVKMYTTQWCGYCAAARELLRYKGVDFEDIDVDSDPALRAEMTLKSGGTTVPQIFINDQPVGGYSDIATLEQQGELTTLLSQD
jgi:glutaredoxin 3